MKISIIGAGLTGLTAGFRLSKDGHLVTIFEKGNRLGGLASGFKKDNWQWSLEDFFHHLFTSDNKAKELIAELGLADKLFYVRPKTSIFKDGKIFQFDSPTSVMFSPYLSLPDKLRVGLVTGYLKLVSNWQNLEKIPATKWLKRYYGQRPYRVLWEPLIRSKFSQQAENISMAWFWSRIKKRSVKLGYLKGGFQVVIDKLAEQIKVNKGEIISGKEIKNLKELKKDFEKVIVTTPTDVFFKTKLPPMLGALNLALSLKERFLSDGTYWLNINEGGFPFVAVVEQTNLVNKKHYGGENILYVGGYYPQNHPYFRRTAPQILAEFLPYLQKINPNFSSISVISYNLSRSLYAQPVMPTNYSKIIPAFQTEIKNIFLANMQMVYPWDRGVNYAIDMGNKIAGFVEMFNL